MKKNIIISKAFTLVEVLVSITIFSLVITSVIWIYITSTDILVKSDINRKMQENLKNVTSHISEDIRKDWIIWISESTTDSSCDFTTWDYKEWNKLCTKSQNNYYLAKKDELTWLYLRVNNSSCSELKDNCVIYRLYDWGVGNNWPLTNSFVSVKDLKFYLSDEHVPKVTMSIVMQPSAKKWVKTNLIQESIFIFETTISERPF